MFEQLRAYLAQYLTLSDHELQCLTPLLKPRRFDRKESVIEPGIACSFDVFIETGCLRVYSVTPDGSDRNLHFGTENSWWCHGATGGSLVPFSLGIEAVEASRVLVINKESKERLCGSLPRFDRLFRFLTERSVGALQQRLVISMQSTAEARYQEFTRLYPRLERRIPQYHLASYLGICPEFLSKLRRKVGKTRLS